MHPSQKRDAESVGASSSRQGPSPNAGPVIAQRLPGNPSSNAGFGIACYNAGAHTEESFKAKRDWLYSKLRADMKTLQELGASIVAMQDGGASGKLLCNQSYTQAHT